MLPFDDLEAQKAFVNDRKQEDVESARRPIRTVAISFDDRERGRRNELLRTQMFDGDADRSRRKVKDNPLDGRFFRHSCSMTKSVGK